MEHVTFKPQGVCSIQIDFDLEDGKLHNLKFINGCNGNLKAIGRLVEGKDAREVADILRGNDCKNRGTSCADQFARAIDQKLANA
ncbi:MAG: TIGR03905 family TSCPD domain-containing protein [Treponema sp.]|nr:TIGR03905 family TSCPD domain-containing protein [Treponema sp.]